MGLLHSICERGLWCPLHQHRSHRVKDGLSKACRAPCDRALLSVRPRLLLQPHCPLCSSQFIKPVPTSGPLHLPSPPPACLPTSSWFSLTWLRAVLDSILSNGPSLWPSINYPPFSLACTPCPPALSALSLLHSCYICYFYVQFFIVIYMVSFCPVTSKCTSECECLKDKDFIYFLDVYFYLFIWLHLP